MYQWRGGSEAAGEAARLMVPPPSHTSFGFWSGMRIMSKAQHAMTVGHCAIHLSGCGRYKQFHSRVLVEVQGVRPLKAPKNLHLTVPNSGSNIAQQ